MPHKRRERYYFDEKTKTVQKRFGKPKISPKIVVYIPHYEDDLRMEFDVPDPNASPELTQKTLNDYKHIFVNWFGKFNRQLGRFEQWNIDTRRYMYRQIRTKTTKVVQLEPEQKRAMRSLMLYPNILENFKAGKTRKEIVDEYVKKSYFEYTTAKGRTMIASRRSSTINRDISSLKKTGIIQRVSKGIYRVIIK